MYLLRWSVRVTLCCIYPADDTYIYNTYHISYVYHIIKACYITYIRKYCIHYKCNTYNITYIGVLLDLYTHTYMMFAARYF